MKSTNFHNYVTSAKESNSSCPYLLKNHCSWSDPEDFKKSCITHTHTQKNNNIFVSNEFCKAMIAALNYWRGTLGENTSRLLLEQNTYFLFPPRGYFFPVLMKSAILFCDALAWFQLCCLMSLPLDCFL